MLKTNKCKFGNIKCTGLKYANPKRVNYTKHPVCYWCNYTYMTIVWSKDSDAK